jgi:hypothetical protein
MSEDAPISDPSGTEQQIDWSKVAKRAALASAALIGAGMSSENTLAATHPPVKPPAETQIQDPANKNVSYVETALESPIQLQIAEKWVKEHPGSKILIKDSKLTKQNGQYDASVTLDISQKGKSKEYKSHLRRNELVTMNQKVNEATAMKAVEDSALAKASGEKTH